MGFVTRFALYTCVLAMIGSVVFSMIVLPRALSDETLLAQLQRRASVAGLMAAVLLLPLEVLRLYFQLNAMRFPGEPLFQSFSPLMSGTTWGKAWVIQTLAAFVAALAFRLSGMMRFRRFAAWVAVAVVVLVAVTVALSGHAAGVEGGARQLAIVADTLHVLGAGAWMGTLAIVAAFVLIPSLTGTTAIVARDRYEVIRAFSPLALVSASVVAASGVLSASIHIDTADALIGSGYGRTLLVKLFCVTAVLLAGYVNWKKNTPRIPDDNGTSIRSGALRELAAAIVVLLVTSALVVASPP